MNIETDFSDCKHIFLDLFFDNRGGFSEKWNKSIENELNVKFVQENFSISNKNVLRGLHYQLRNPQGKLIWCPSGKILDVVVDLRYHSPTYGKHHKFLIGIDSMLYIPEGFAHGFLALEPKTIVVYNCTDYYDPEDSYTLQWNDKHLNIDWRTIETPILSEKDKFGMSFQDCPKFF